MVTKYKIALTRSAKKEINRIYDYILEDLYAEKAANDLLQKVEESIDGLMYSPRIYARIDKLDEVKRIYRRIVIKNFVILYTIDDEQDIVYVAHMYYSGRNYLELI